MRALRAHPRRETRRGNETFVKADRLIPPILALPAAHPIKSLSIAGPYARPASITQ
jgi:hypothetical protein